MEVKPLKWSELIFLFGVPTIFNLLACKVAIPLLDSQNSFPIEISYFLSVGLLVLAPMFFGAIYPVSYTHLRAHETVLDLVCRLLLEKKKSYINISIYLLIH